MKLKYKCSRCSQMFSRKWNMREHCRNQHGFDPYPGTHIPPIESQAKSSNLQQSVAVPIVLSQRLSKTMGDLIKTRRRTPFGPPEKELLNSMISLEFAIKYLLDNFVHVDKGDIRGISGYYCKTCLSFEMQYIKDIGYDKSAKNKHAHMPSVDGVYLEEKEVRQQAYRLLVAAMGSVFPGQRYLEASSYLDMSHLMNFEGPRIILESITPDHWAYPAIERKQVAIDNMESNNIVKKLVGTFALIFVQNGDHSGYHVVRITNSFTDRKSEDEKILSEN